MKTFMQALIPFVAIVAVLTGTRLQAAATYPNPNCGAPDINGEVACDLLEGTYEIGVGPNQYVKFTNRTGGYLQIDSVQGITNEQTYWSEICVYLDDFFLGQRPQSPGVGEVGCVHKLPGENYPPLTWYGPIMANALSVRPNGIVYMNSNTPGHSENHTYVVTSARQTVGVNSWRSPQADPVQVSCTPLNPPDPYAYSAWQPWQNTTGHNVYVGGATIYAVTATDSSAVSLACLYIRTSAQITRWCHCSEPASSDGVSCSVGATNVRGQLNLPSQTVLPNEYIAGQAANLCPSGGWNWAAYLYVSNAPILPIRTTCCRDFDGDGKADIVWGDTAGDVLMWLMNGASVSSSNPLGNVTSVWSVAGVADFSGDSKAD